MIDVQKGDYPFASGQKWFQPSVKYASELMRYVYLNQELAIKKADLGKADILSKYSIDATAKFINLKLRTIGK